MSDSRAHYKWNNYLSHHSLCQHHAFLKIDVLPACPLTFLQLCISSRLVLQDFPSFECEGWEDEDGKDPVEILFVCEGQGAIQEQGPLVPPDRNGR